MILDGENKDKSAPYIQGSKGKIARGYQSDIPDIQQLIAKLPDPPAQATDFLD